MPGLSVIVPAYNREKLIGVALRSLLRQRDAVDLDILVIDDGSTDGTVAAVQQLMASAPCIRIVVQPNLGVTRARNTGLRHLPPDAEYVTFLDSDDVCPAGRLASDLAPLRSDPALDLTYAMICMVDDIDEERLAPAAGATVRVLRGVQLAAGIYRRRLLQAVGEFDETFDQGEDTDFLFRIFERKPARLLLDNVGVYYRQHPDSLVREREAMRLGFMKAVLKSSKRRMRDPALGELGEIFNSKAWQEARAAWPTERQAGLSGEGTVPRDEGEGTGPVLGA